ncbi:hypothetical protein [Amycolatopsis alkalitolerans]|uniref:MotA/TolQ/ExbB proton channel domain-containing protein n=1 Tax=Amycolatopsis alkalitolerans TaxID=2547244 RepID=A0A5C4LS91_9PSEU|nr:hypothetical protein [Amycolatopsis alkalitolerans]TNC20300.1 hypothetical protein FG385_31055 [Amycolatopsis alkalitolerans]
MPKPGRTFWYAAVLGVAVTALLAVTGLTSIFPVVGQLVGRGGAAGSLALAVLAVVLWALFAIAGQSMTAERRVIAARAARSRELHPGLSADVAGFLLASHSGVDAAKAETPYGPVRALVWSLPALGFLGTATEMSSAVGGLGTAVASTNGYADLRDVLVRDVIPPLGDAFGVTLFALASSVVCHVLLSLVHAREQRMLLDSDTIELRGFAQNGYPAGGQSTMDIPELQRLNENLRAVAAGVQGMTGGVQEQLSQVAGEVSQWRKAIAESGERLGALAQVSELGRLVDLTTAIERQVGEIGSRMDREIVLRPAPSTPSALDGYHRREA